MLGDLKKLTTPVQQSRQENLHLLYILYLRIEDDEYDERGRVIVKFTPSEEKRIFKDIASPYIRVFGKSQKYFH